MFAISFPGIFVVMDQGQGITIIIHYSLISYIDIYIYMYIYVYIYLLLCIDIFFLPNFCLNRPIGVLMLI